MKGIFARIMIFTAAMILVLSITIKSVFAFASLKIANQPGISFVNSQPGIGAGVVLQQTEPPPVDPTEPPPVDPTEPPPVDPTEPPPVDPTEPPPVDPTEPPPVDPTEPPPVDPTSPPPVDPTSPPPVDPTSPPPVIPTIAALSGVSIPKNEERQATEPVLFSTTPRGPKILIFNLDPVNVETGDLVTIHAKVDSPNLGATKIIVTCGSLSKEESSEVEFSSTWNTRGCSTGKATVTLLTRAKRDLNWRNPGRMSKSIALSTVADSIAPVAVFSADPEKIIEGQCTVLHWTTTGAKSVEIDGVIVNAEGQMRVCPATTKNFSLTAFGQTESVNSNITVLVTDQFSFQTGDLIDIGGKIYLILFGQRLLIPNPVSLDALGLSGEDIDNKGVSDFDLLAILRGEDIPDVSVDPIQFEEFKAYLSQTLPDLIASIPGKSDAPALLGPNNNDYYPVGVSLKFDWAGRGNNFLLKVSGGPYAEPIVCDWQPGTSCILHELLEGSYTWQVKARTTAGQESEWSKPQAFTIQSGTNIEPIVPVTGGVETSQVVGRCLFFCEIKLFAVKTWSKIWNTPMVAAAPEPENVYSFLTNRAIHVGSYIGEKRSGMDLVQFFSDFPGFEGYEDANTYIENSGEAVPLTDINQIQHCSTLFMNVGTRPSSTKIAFVYGVDKEKDMITIIHQNYLPGMGVNFTNIEISKLDFSSTYFVDSNCK